MHQKNSEVVIASRHKKYFLILVAITVVLNVLGCGGGGGGSGGGRSVSLSWEPSRVNTDGTLLRDLWGYRVYYGKNTDKAFTNAVDVGWTTAASISGLASGVWCFAVTAYDVAGNESEYSKEVCAEV